MGVRLPADYQETEWIGSNNDAYLVIKNVVGLPEIKNLKVKTTVLWKNVLTKQTQGRNGTGRCYFGVSNRYYSNAQSGTGHTQIKAVANEWASVEWSKNDSVYTLKVGNDIDITNLTTTTYGKWPFGLFALGDGSIKCYCDLKETQVEIGSEQFDLIPCYRKQDSKPGMYDLVSGTFFTNAGTGEFTVGPDVIDSISPLMVAWRRAMMSQMQPRLPAEYQEVEYLESTGTQYINTWIVGRDSIYAESRLMFTQTDLGNAGFLGTRQGGGDQRFYLISVWQGVWQLGLGEDFFSTTAVLPNTLYDIKVGRDWNTYRFALNVNGADILSGSSRIQSTYDMYVFAVNNYGTASRFCSARLYLLKISNDNSLLRDYIPCYRKSDNKPGMYDLVSNTFFTNAGTGEFVVGADVN